MTVIFVKPYLLFLTLVETKTDLLCNKCESDRVTLFRENQTKRSHPVTCPVM